MYTHRLGSSFLNNKAKMRISIFAYPPNLLLRESIHCSNKWIFNKGKKTKNVF